mgnify:CR=1 FL=1
MASAMRGQAFDNVFRHRREGRVRIGDAVRRETCSTPSLSDQAAGSVDLLANIAESGSTALARLMIGVRRGRGFEQV